MSRTPHKPILAPDEAHMVVIQVLIELIEYTEKNRLDEVETALVQAAESITSIKSHTRADPCPGQPDPSADLGADPRPRQPDTSADPGDDPGTADNVVSLADYAERRRG